MVTSKMLHSNQKANRNSEIRISESKEETVEVSRTHNEERRLEKFNAHKTWMTDSLMCFLAAYKLFGRYLKPGYI